MRWSSGFRSYGFIPEAGSAAPPSDEPGAGDAAQATASRIICFRRKRNLQVIHSCGMFSFTKMGITGNNL